MNGTTQPLQIELELWALLIIAGLAVLAFLFLRSQKFFGLGPRRLHERVRFFDVLSGFLVLLFCLAVILPISLAVGSVIEFGALGFSAGLSRPVEAGCQIGGLIVICALVVLFWGWIRSDLRQAMLWGDRPASMARLAGDLRVAVLALLLGFPVTMVVHLASRLALFLLFPEQPPTDQLAVLELATLLDYPVLFALMTLCTVTIVPLLEEWIFRGLIQSWFRGRMPRRWAILLSSFIFASMHFAAAQGLSNISLILALTFFSFFLGYVYEKQQSLFASVCLHGMFNGVSILGMVLQG